jgi:KaiC/GvpD/RAD55 family RecA-like ATPase
MFGRAVGGHMAESGSDVERLGTGLAAVDRALGGGVPAGRLVAVVAPASVSAEPLLYAAAGANPARYLAALRPRTTVERDLAAHGVEATVEAVEGDALLDSPAAHLDGLDRSVLVVDPVTEAEQGERRAYRDFLDAVGRACRMTDSVAYLHCVETTPPTLRRDLSLSLADLVFDVDLRAGGAVGTRLTVTKAGGCRLPERQFRLRFDPDGVEATPVED